MQSHEQTSICICMCSAHIFIDTYTGTHAHTNTHGLAALSVSLQCFTGRQSDWEHWYPESFQFWLSLRYKSYDLWRQHLEVHGLWQDLGNRPWRFDSTGIFRNAEGERQDLVWKRLTQPCSLECRCGRWKGVGVHTLLSEQSKRRISSFCNFAPFLIWFPAPDFAVSSWIWGFLAQICLFGKVGQRSIQISAIYKLFQTEFGFVQRRKKQMLADKLTSSQLRTNNGPFQLWTCVQRAQSRCTRRHASLPLLTLSQTMQRLSTREQIE